MLQITSEIPKSTIMSLSNKGDSTNQFFGRFWSGRDSGNERESISILLRSEGMSWGNRGERRWGRRRRTTDELFV